MGEFLKPLFELRGLTLETLVQVLDILLVSYLIYRILGLIRGTRAWRIVSGVVFFVILLVASKQLGLYSLNWILEKATLLGPVALVILLLPELRHALEGFGKLGFWPSRITGFETRASQGVIDELIAAGSRMAADKIGALIVVETGPELEDIVETGIAIDSKLSSALLESMFYPGNPLHDGAVIVRDDRIVAAACHLPMSQSLHLDPAVHMRHRAAVGVTEERSCVAIAVSEERGAISYASDGELIRVSASELRELLQRDLRGEGQAHKPANRVRILRRNSKKEAEDSNA